MRHTRKSLILFGTLFTLVVFFIGLNLGKYVESLNKSYVPPIPSPTPLVLEPMITPEPVTYKTFTFQECGVSFLMPSNLEKSPTMEPHEVEFNRANKNKEIIDRIFVSCNEMFTREHGVFDGFESSSSAYLAGQTVVTHTLDGDQVWVIRNKKLQKVQFATTGSLTPLIQQTLELQ